MTSVGDDATYNDLTTACELLRNVLCGLAHSFVKERRQEGVQNTRGNLSEGGLESLNVLGQVTVPSMPNNEQVAPRRVRIIRFGDPGGHMAPDPLLLAVKAAVTWSERHEQQLLAKGEVKDDDVTSLSELALEQYAEWQEQCCRAQTLEELAIGLGQPNGFRANDVSVDFGYTSYEDDDGDKKWVANDADYDDLDALDPETEDVNPGFCNLDYYPRDNNRTTIA
jgi:hypothetical protein